MQTRQITQLKPHPLNAEIYGDGCDKELLESIKKHGMLENNPIVITAENAYCGSNVIISGHRRFNAAQMAQLIDVPVSVSPLTDKESIEELLVLLNIGSRERTTEQKAREYRALKRIEEERARKRQLSALKQFSSVVANLPQRDADGKSRDIAAEKVGMKPRTAEKAAQVIDVIDDAKKNGKQEFAAELSEQLNKTVDGAFKEIEPITTVRKEAEADIRRDSLFDDPVETENRIEREANRRAKEKMDEITEQKKLKREAAKTHRKAIAEKLEQANKAITNLNDMQCIYRVIYADPPWQYGNDQTAAMPGSTRPDDHYKTMATKDICDLPVKKLAIKNSVLFMWTTTAHLEESFSVVNAWGFKYKTHIVWDKESHNYGPYTSVQHEILLICTRGSCTPEKSGSIPSVIRIRKTEHSKKPEKFREIIQQMYPFGQKIELFARQNAEGWDVWGNEA